MSDMELLAYFIENAKTKNRKVLLMNCLWKRNCKKTIFDLISNNDWPFPVVESWGNELLNLRREREQLHVLVKEGNIRNLKKIIYPKNFQFYFNTKNESLLSTAIRHDKFEIAAFLKFLGLKMTMRESRLLKDETEKHVPKSLYLRTSCEKLNSKVQDILTKTVISSDENLLDMIDLRIELNKFILKNPLGEEFLDFKYPELSSLQFAEPMFSNISVPFISNSFSFDDRVISNLIDKNPVLKKFQGNFIDLRDMKNFKDFPTITFFKTNGVMQGTLKLMQVFQREKISVSSVNNNINSKFSEKILVIQVKEDDEFSKQFELQIYRALINNKNLKIIFVVEHDAKYEWIEKWRRDASWIFDVKTTLNDFSDVKPFLNQEVLIANQGPKKLINIIGENGIFHSLFPSKFIEQILSGQKIHLFEDLSRPIDGESDLKIENIKSINIVSPQRLNSTHFVGKKNICFHFDLRKFEIGDYLDVEDFNTNQTNNVFFRELFYEIIYSANRDLWNVILCFEGFDSLKSGQTAVIHFWRRLLKYECNLWIESESIGLESVIESELPIVI